MRPLPISPLRMQLSPFSWLELHHGWLPAPGPAMAALTNELAWTQQAIPMFGKDVLQPRLTAVCGKSMKPASRYRRANPDTPWTPMAAQVLDRVHRTCPAWRPNGLIANWYRDGADSIDWHSDSEPALGQDPTVVSASLGATRTFLLKPRDGGPKTAIKLGDGDLLIMGGRTQSEYRHSIAKVQQPTGARISLTFRHYLPTPGSCRPLNQRKGGR